MAVVGLDWQPSPTINLNKIKRDGREQHSEGGIYHHQKL